MKKSLIWFFSIREFLECFKIVEIILVFKSYDSNSTVNYGAISMLPFLSKVFEKWLCPRLVSPEIEQYFMYESVWFPKKIQS